VPAQRRLGDLDSHDDVRRRFADDHRRDERQTIGRDMDGDMVCSPSPRVEAGISELALHEADGAPNHIGLGAVAIRPGNGSESSAGVVVEPLDELGQRGYCLVTPHPYG
jgi:hypothetical protein